MECRHCRSNETSLVVDLGSMPASNSFLKEIREETYYPLKVFVCTRCWLVQISECKDAKEIFTEDYVYHSSQSPANVSHAKEYTEMMCERFKYDNKSRILEIGSNDGYLLQWFVKKGCTVLGIDPATNAVEVALSKGVPSLATFFNEKLALTNICCKGKFDLICNINTLAHQPDINDFVRGMKVALAPKGIITCEFPHLMRTVDGCQLDQFYAEHYSYFSFATICSIFKRHGLEVFNVDEIPEHGGSLRIYAQHESANWWRHDASKVASIIRREKQKGMFNLNYYTDFQKRCEATRKGFLEFLSSHKVVAYGAAAKANTFLNYCKINSTMIPYVVDRSPIKQRQFLPGSHILVVSEEVLREDKPEYILILAWNLKNEIMKQLSYVKEWGAKFVTAIPELEIL